MSVEKALAIKNPEAKEWVQSLWVIASAIVLVVAYVFTNFETKAESEHKVAQVREEMKHEQNTLKDQMVKGMEEQHGDLKEIRATVNELYRLQIHGK